MNKMPTSFRCIGALWFALLLVATGNALATPTYGTRFNNWCAQQPIQATAPQQSRPYQAAGSACTVCHTSGNPSKNDLNTVGVASRTCTGTVCGATMNPFCVATAPRNASITAPADGTSVALGQSVTFTAAAATNPDGFPLTYRWLFSSGQANATGQSVAVPMNVAGTVTATLQVLNSVGMLATGATPTRTVIVGGTVPTNQPPVASISSPATNVSVAQGGTVNFQGAASDPDNNLPLTYAWSFPGGSPASSTAQNPGLVAYNTAGSFTASLVVTDSRGLAGAAVTRTVTVSAAGQKLTASIDAPAINVSVLPGGKVDFRGSGAASANLPLTYRWKFPEGSPSSSSAQNPGLVTYGKAGVFTATLTVTDAKGGQSQPVTRTVTVASPNQAPPAVAQCIGGDGDDDEDDEDDDHEESNTDRRSGDED